MKQVLKSSRYPVRQFSPTTVVELFEAQVQSTPDAEALTDGITSLSYQQLNTVSNQLAHELMERGIGPKHWVGIFMERSIDAIVSLLATLKSGAGYLPMDVHHPVERIQKIMPLPTFWWDLSGRGIKIKTPDMKEDIGLEAFSIAVAIGFLDQASDSIVKTFEGGVGDSVGKVG